MPVLVNMRVGIMANSCHSPVGSAGARTAYLIRSSNLTIAVAHLHSTRVPRRLRRCLWMSSSMSAFSLSARITMAFPPALSFARHYMQPKQALLSKACCRGSVNRSNGLCLAC